MGSFGKKYGSGIYKVASRAAMQIRKTFRSIESLLKPKQFNTLLKSDIEYSANLPHPLQGTTYTNKVWRQMEASNKTGGPDFHGFPRIVDNYARFGKQEIITGRDGISRMKISLDGSYGQHRGQFEWIIESDKTINHRLFIPKN